MKKILSLLLIVSLLVSLSACELTQIADLLGSMDASDWESLLQILDRLNSAEQPDPYDQWGQLTGYWNGNDGTFFALDMADSHTALISGGIWGAGGGRGYGTVTDLILSTPTQLTATVFYPAVTEDNPDGPMPEETVTVVIDFSGCSEQPPRILIGGSTYTFAGDTAEEAYQAYLDSIGGT